MSVNNRRRDQELPEFFQARARMQVYIGNVPLGMTPRRVGLILESHGYGTPCAVLLSRSGGLMRDFQEGIVTFCTEDDARLLRQAGQNRRALLWPDGRFAVTRPALCRGIIPGDRHHKAGGYAAQKASKRQFCG